MTVCRSSTTLSQSLLHLGGPRPRDGALQGEPDGEQPLDHVVVQVAGDAVAVGEHVEFAHPALRAGQLPGQRGLVGERGHHVELVGAERQTPRRAAAPRGHRRRCRWRAAAAPAPGPRRNAPVSDVEAVETSRQCAARTASPIAVPATGIVSAARGGRRRRRAVPTTTSSSTSPAGRVGVGAAPPRTSTSAPLSLTGLVGDEPKNRCRIGTGQQFGADVAGGLDPRLPDLGLLVEPGVVDRDARRCSQGLDQHLVVLAERLPAGLLGQVQVAEHLVADPHRHPEERPHRRMVGRKTDRFRHGGRCCRAGSAWGRRSAPRARRGPPADDPIAPGRPRRCPRR